VRELKTAGMRLGAARAYGRTTALDEARAVLFEVEYGA
jgi:hypothetical protein